MEPSTKVSSCRTHVDPSTGFPWTGNLLLPKTHHFTIQCRQEQLALSACQAVPRWKCAEFHRVLDLTGFSIHRNQLATLPAFDGGILSDQQFLNFRVLLRQLLKRRLFVNDVRRSHDEQIESCQNHTSNVDRNVRLPFRFDQTVARL